MTASFDEEHNNRAWLASLFFKYWPDPEWWMRIEWDDDRYNYIITAVRGRGSGRRADGAER